MLFSNTPEQDHIIESWHTTPAPMKVRAIAGAGKSFLLRQIASRTDALGLYVCFNKEIMLEAEGKFPRTVHCRTSHSLAKMGLRLNRENPKSKMIVNNIFPNALVPILDLKDADGYSAHFWAQAISETVSNFCNSSDAEIEPVHCTQFDANTEELEIIIDKSRLFWAKQWEKGTKVPITHDNYLKRWEMDGAEFYKEFEYILFDEAQDANPILLKALSRHKIPIIYVGDPWQSIYSFRGARNALQNLSTREFTLSQSFRYGQSIANVCHYILNHSQTPPDFRFRGNSTINSNVGPLRAGPYCIICRTNARILEYAVAEDGPIYIAGGADRVFSLLLNAQKLLKKETQEKTSPLKRFKSYSDMEEFAYEKGNLELKALCTVVQAYQRNLATLLNQMKAKIITNKKAARIVLGTVHQLKGQEFRQVRLASDFPLIQEVLEIEDPAQRNEEVNLLYVAATRAIETLQINKAVESYALMPPPKRT